MKHERVQIKFFTWPTALFLILMIGGVVAVVLRMMHGLGASTNLSDDWPWGLCQGFNVLCLIALGAGGFTSAALIYIFGGEKYHGFARPTALWAFLCYSFASLSLAVDIGIPWRIVNPIYMWPRESILFEVSWCIMLYLCVLSLELAPSVFERFGWTGLESVWKKLTTPFAVIALSFFTFIMSHSIVWAAVSLVFFAILSILLAGVKHKPSMPVLLIMFGVILSVLHQSSLGSLFLLMPQKLSHFWWSPRLPFNFFLSAVTVGFSMLIIERTISAHVFKRPRPDDLLEGISRFAAVFLWVYIVFRVTDIVVEFGSVLNYGSVDAAFAADKKGSLFLIEMFIGFLLPAGILSLRRGRQNPGLRITAAALIVFGVILNRLNVTFMGMMSPGSYFPGLFEIIVSVATVAAILFFFTIGAKLMPIYRQIDREESNEIRETAVSPLKVTN